eukprot:m.35457 g.35457  ORF g.35457 m.35457 type:complete len:272 (+) comp10928_c0_seq1:90-905(+)
MARAQSEGEYEALLIHPLARSSDIQTVHDEGKTSLASSQMQRQRVLLANDAAFALWMAWSLAVFLVYWGAWHLVYDNGPGNGHSAATFFQAVAAYALFHCALFHAGACHRHFCGGWRTLGVTLATCFFFPGVYRGIQALIPSGAFLMLSAQGFEQLNALGWVICVVALLLVAGVVIYHVYRARQRSRRFCIAYFGSFVALGLVVVLAATIGPHWNAGAFHIHHYMWASVLSFFTRFDTTTSRVCQALFVGVVTQEVSGLGLVSFYDPKVPP